MIFLNISFQIQMNRSKLYWKESDNNKDTIFSIWKYQKDTVRVNYIINKNWKQYEIQMYENFASLMFDNYFKWS